MKRAAFLSPLALAAALTGCASTLSGIGGTERYACKAPEGALCTSVSGVYANSVHGVLTSSQPAAKLPVSTPAYYGATSTAPLRAEVPSSTLRSNPRVLRLWIAPWEDSDGDLHEESLVHVVVEPGRWLIEHVRPTRGSRVDRVAPPIAPVEAPPTEKPVGDSTQAPTRLPLPPGRVLPGSESRPAER